MANDTMNLQALVGKSVDADFLREMIGSVAAAFDVAEDRQDERTLSAISLKPT